MDKGARGVVEDQDDEDEDDELYITDEDGQGRPAIRCQTGKQGCQRQAQLELHWPSRGQGR